MLIQLYDIWLTAAENKELSAALLQDLSVAFDIVDRDIFFTKLKGLWVFGWISLNRILILGRKSSKFKQSFLTLHN